MRRDGPFLEMAFNRTGYMAALRWERREQAESNYISIEVLRIFPFQTRSCISADSSPFGQPLEHLRLTPKKMEVLS